MNVVDSVSDILKQKSGEVYSISPDANVYDAVETMAEKEIGALVVLDGARLAGIISERDYARKVILKGRSSKDTLVKDIMTAHPVTIGADCKVDEAMRTMTEHRVRHLPVVNADGSLRGLVSIGDLVKWIISSHEQTIEQLQVYIAGQY
jgi:CBS domain-containing protein